MIDTMYYNQVSFLVSLVTTGLLAGYAWFVAQRYHRRHDDRAAIDLAVAISFAVASLGLAVSSFGNVTFDPAMGLAGRAVTRTAIFLATVVLVGNEWDTWRRKERHTEYGEQL